MCVCVWLDVPFVFCVHYVCVYIGAYVSVRVGVCVLVTNVNSQSLGKDFILLCGNLLKPLGQEEGF